MTQQVSSIIQCVNYHLRNISHIHRNIDKDTCKPAVQSLIFSCIDYGKALLLGVTEKDLICLQRLLNDHPSAPLLKNFNWLQIHMYIQFKILVYVYKCRHTLAPEYLSDLVLPLPVKYATRSLFDTFLLHIPKTKTVAGDSAIHAAAPRLWSKLPRNIREAPTIHVLSHCSKLTFLLLVKFFAIFVCLYKLL